MSKRVISVRVEKGFSRVDLLLKESLAAQGHELSRNRIKSWFQDKQVLIGERAIPGSLELTAGVYEVTLLDFNTEEVKAATSKYGSFLPIIYEDADLLVLNKSSGTPSVPHQSEESETAVGSALAHFGELEKVGRRGLEPGIIHRLDTETSGLLVFAKNQREYERVSQLWKVREVEKIYRAVVHLQEPKPHSNFKISFPLAHDSKSNKRMIALTDPKFKHYRGNPLPAQTEILEAKAIGNLGDYTIQIETGVMHQIRCHLATLDWPILGDRIYSRLKSKSELQIESDDTTRMWLHAWKLKFKLGNGELLCLEAPLPEGWPFLIELRSEETQKNK